MRTEARGTPLLTRVPASRYVCFLTLAAAGLAWDLYSKWFVFRSLGAPGGASAWIWPQNWGWEGLAPIVQFQLHTNFNAGALWGMGQGKSWLFATFSICAACGILYWLFVRKGAVSWWLTVAMGFVMAGILGNLYDRLGLHGWQDENQTPVYAVRDFLHFWFFAGTPAHFDFAIFNFADTFLVTGAIMLIVHSLFLQPVQETATGISAVAAKTPPAT